MAETFVTVNGVKMAGWDRVRNTQTVVDEFTLPGEFPYPSYTITASAVALATAASHLLQIMAGGANHVRIRRVTVSGLSVPAAVTAMEIVIVRLTTAGTGGGALTPRPADTVDTAGATGMTLPTVKGTEGVTLYGRGVMWGTAAIPIPKPELDWIQHPSMKPIIIPSGVANGIAIKNITGVATATCDITVELVETAFL